jgi:hypothetical protein
VSSGDLLFSSFAPAAPGDAGLSFFGIIFDDARVARVAITSGNVGPGAGRWGKHDVVMMDDFLYGSRDPFSDVGFPGDDPDCGQRPTSSSSPGDLEVCHRGRDEAMVG